ncbi:MAG: hypothetical protein LBD91_07630 [Prevotellaceae bacterium]|nr:hypothetical protein [Prevotellaceae bacterium]
MPPTEINNIELRSEEVQEILGRPPQWIIWWGIAAILLLSADYSWRVISSNIPKSSPTTCACCIVS